MKTIIFERVKRAFASINLFHPLRALAVVLMGILVATTTACSTQPPDVTSTGAYNEKTSQTTGLREYTDRADGKSRPDLSSYKDQSADDSASTRAKAKELARKAERNIDKAQNPDEFATEFRKGTPLDQRVRNISDDVGEAASETADDVSEGTRKGLRNLKQNIDRAGDALQDTAADVQRSAKRTLDNATGA